MGDLSDPKVNIDDKLGVEYAPWKETERVQSLICAPGQLTQATASYRTTLLNNQQLRTNLQPRGQPTC